LAITTSPDPPKEKLPVKVERLLASPAWEWNREQAKMLADYYETIAPILNPTRSNLARERALLNQLASPVSLIMKELASPRQTHVLSRGNFLSPGKEVQPGV